MISGEMRSSTIGGIGAVSLGSLPANIRNPIKFNLNHSLITILFTELIAVV
jgi:hypothetical protein